MKKNKLNLSNLKNANTDRAKLGWMTGEDRHIPEGIRLGNVKYTDINSLTPNSLNSTFNSLSADDFEKLKEDIKERGIIVPLIADKNGVLLAGHNRIKAAKELKLTKVPVQYVESDLSDEQEKEFLFKDNIIRRQLTPADKRKIIEELFAGDIEQDNRGGDRKSETAKIKSSDELLIPLPQKVEKMTGIPEGTAKRIIAAIRKDIQHKTETTKSEKQTVKQIEKKMLAVKRLIKKLDENQISEAGTVFKKQVREINKLLK